MKKALYLLLLASGAAVADDAAILKCRALPDSASRLACYDAIPVGAPAPAARTPASAPVAKTPEQSFGMETMARKQEPDQPKSIESSVAGDFAGWRPGSMIRLANGQVWRVVDDSAVELAPMRNPKVRITRNMFGTLFLQVEGSNHSAKVRRVQ